MPAPPPASACLTRAQWRERFIQRQLAGLKQLGLPDAALAREEALLPGAVAAGDKLAEAAPPSDVV